MRVPGTAQEGADIVTRPRLLDLFCCAGGAAMGYFHAGFDVTGIDIKPQAHYPFAFIQADALEYVAAHGHEYDVIHASPPCQAYSEATPMAYRGNHADLIGPTRALLVASGKPYAIENVESARHLLHEPVKLCGSMFGLYLWRHRYFEIWTGSPQGPFALLPPCFHKHELVPGWIDGAWRKVQTPVLCTGGGDGKRNKRKTHRPRQPVKEIRWAMGIDWMTQDELTEAIPPAMTRWIGEHLLSYLRDGERQQGDSSPEHIPGNAAFLGRNTDFRLSMDAPAGNESCGRSGPVMSEVIGESFRQLGLLQDGPD